MYEASVYFQLYSGVGCARRNCFLTQPSQSRTHVWIKFEYCRAFILPASSWQEFSDTWFRPFIMDISSPLLKEITPLLGWYIISVFLREICENATGLLWNSGTRLL